MNKDLEKEIMDYGLSLVVTGNSYIIKGTDITSGEYQTIYTGNLSEIKAFLHGMNYLSSKTERLLEQKYQNKVDWHGGLFLSTVP